MEAKLGDKSVSRTIAFDRGQEQTLILELPKTAGGAGKSSVTDAAAKPSERGAGQGSASASANATTDTGAPSGANIKTIGMIASGAVAVLGAGVGVGFLMAKNSAADDADALKKENALGDSGCSASPKPAACGELADANDRATRNSTLSTIGFIGAGVGVAGFVTFLLLPDKKSATTAIHPLVDQHTVGLGAYGRF